MASSVSEQDELNTGLWLAIQSVKLELKPYDKSFINQATHATCRVKHFRNKNRLLVASLESDVGKSWKRVNMVSLSLC